MAEATNRFLESLSSKSKKVLVNAASVVSLPLGTAVFDPIERPHYAYFLTSGITSYVTMMSGGRAAEVSVVGPEGIVGGLQLLGPALHPIHAMMQMDGSGLRIPLTALERAFHDSAEIRARALESIQSTAFTTLQIAGCGVLHEVEARLSRWLLMISDRTATSEMQFTQEFLAQMMGARRTTVTMVAQAMQQRGLIQYSRGRVRITDRKALEKTACSCYKVTKDLLDGLYTHLHN